MENIEHMTKITNTLSKMKKKNISKLNNNKIGLIINYLDLKEKLIFLNINKSFRHCILNSDDNFTYNLLSTITLVNISI